MKISWEDKNMVTLSKNCGNNNVKLNFNISTNSVSEGILLEPRDHVVPDLSIQLVHRQDGSDDLYGLSDWEDELC